MTGKRIAMAGAGVLLVSMFLDWYAFEITGARVGGDTTINAWQAFAWIDLVMVLTIVSAVCPEDVPVLGNPRSAFATGAVTTGLIVYRWLDTPVESGSTGFATVEISVQFGLLVGLLGAVLIAVGGALGFTSRS